MPSQELRKSLFVLRRPLLVMAATFLLALAGVAPAFAGPPTGDFAVFSQCQLTIAELCIYAQSTAGELPLGKDTVPITKTITLQGGSYEVAGQEEFIGAENGETLSPISQRIPGGLAAVVEYKSLPSKLRELYEEDIENGIDGVTATLELVNNPGISLENLVNQDGVALSLPVRIALSSPFLGSGCHIGSKTSPITFQLTSGTTSPSLPNEPITGTPGYITFMDNFELIVFKGYKLLDNALSLPVAEGCGGAESAVVDPAVDAELALPSQDGHNTAVLEGTLKVATETAVLAST